MKKYFLILLCLSPFFISAKIPPACPHLQAGYVEAVLSPEGYTIIEVDYPCQFSTVPVLVVSPTGQGSLSVARFEANSLTGEVGSIAVLGEPSVAVRFSWLATLP